MMNGAYSVENKNCYTKTLLVSENVAKQKNVRVIAEVKDNSEIARQYPGQGDYSIDFFLEVGRYGLRYFLSGTFLGKTGMTQEQLDEEIFDLADNVMYNIASDVEQYMRRVYILDKYFDPSK